jgi:hypothetical protein
LELKPINYEGVADALTRYGDHSVYQAVVLSKTHNPVLETIQALQKQARGRISTLDSSFTCQTLPAEYSPYNFCSGVVDYAFNVATGQNLTTLESTARTWASYYTTLINPGCLTDIKRMICSAVYLPCVPGVVPDDLSTYEAYYEGAVLLPYRRPCM